MSPCSTFQHWFYLFYWPFSLWWTCSLLELVSSCSWPGFVSLVATFWICYFLWVGFVSSGKFFYLDLPGRSPGTVFNKDPSLTEPQFCGLYLDPVSGHDSLVIKNFEIGLQITLILKPLHWIWFVPPLVVQSWSGSKWWNAYSLSFLPRAPLSFPGPRLHCNDNGKVVFLHFQKCPGFTGTCGDNDACSHRSVIKPETSNK